MTAPYQTSPFTPGEGALAGAAILITLYGAVVVVASLAADKDLVPTSLPLTGLLLLGLLAGGALLGAVARIARPAR